MEVSEEDIKIFDQYLDGELSKEAQLHLEQRLNSDQVFKENYDQYINSTAAIKTIQFSGEIAQVLEEETSKEKKTINLKTAIIGIAAGIAMVLVSYFAIDLSSGATAEEIFHAYYEAYPALKNARGNDTDIYTEVISAYSENNYELVIDLVEDKVSNKTDDIHLILAISYMEQNSFENAYETLDFIDNKGLYSEQKQWYQALCLIASGRSSEASAILRSFDKSHYKSDQSKELLSILNKAN